MVPLNSLNKNITVVTCVFHDGGKVVSFYSKAARGLMARFICTNQSVQMHLQRGNSGSGKSVDGIIDVLKTFNLAGYAFCKQEGYTLIFSRASLTAEPSSSTVSLKSGSKRKRKDV